jgi:hypothetical protein
MRRESGPHDGVGQHGDLPDEWSQSLRHELAAALACSTQSAETTAWLAWEQQARLPGIGLLLDGGTLTFAKARAVVETFKYLTDADACRAEALILDQLAGKSYTQVLRLAEQAALTVDPGLAERRREQTQRQDAEALAWAEARAARAAAEAQGGQKTEDLDDGPGGEGAYSGRRNPGSASSGNPGGDDDPGGRGAPGPDGPTPEPDTPTTGLACQRRAADLIVPLVTLLGLAERPGEIQGFGLLDPGLARELAGDAAARPRTEVCVTVTSPEGYAIGHGCARPDRRRRPEQATTSPGPLPGLPARLNLTIPGGSLPNIAGNSRHAGPWAFTPRGSPASSDRTAPNGKGSPDHYGSWALTLPGGRRLVVRLDPLLTFECDHRYETHGYRPNDRLRHLVQVRDGTCTFPPCSRHARESDFEHALPYDKGGRTCTCNAGARSRACHRVKQSPGWNVTQPKPGWHRWETPSGHVYTQEPKRYLA